MSAWENLGAVPPGELAAARVELHWAAQVAAATGKLLLPAQADASEQSFAWDGRARALAQGAVAAPRPFRSALAFDPPALALLDEAGTDLARMPLAGHTLDEAYTWLERAVEALLGRPLPGPLERPPEHPDHLPPHPVAEAGTFSGGGPAFAELARWFADLDGLLHEVAEETPGASPVRCWPHHFDLATLVALDADSPDSRADREAARSIGIGMSPGDSARPAPYLYATPWPYPPESARRHLPPLPAGGVWNTEEWVGAVLDAASLVAAGPPAAQHEAAAAFVGAAVAYCREWLGA
jgi:hypothetical protein